MSFSLEGGHLYELDQLIKNAEFENKLQDKAILVEQEKIDAFKKEIATILNEIKRMERETDENKLLQTKYNQKSPQYKENYESLKKTSVVLDEHIDALEKKLETKCQFLFEQREKRSEAIDRYEDLWASYKKKYESSEKAQQYVMISEEVSRLEKYNEQFENQVELLKMSLENRQLQLQKKDSFNQIIPWIIQFASCQVEKEQLYSSIKELHTSNCNLIKQVKYTENEIKKAKEQQVINDTAPPPHSNDDNVNVLQSQRLPVPTHITKPTNIIKMPTLQTPMHTTANNKSSVISPPVSRPSSTVNLPSTLSRPSMSFNIPAVSKPTNSPLPLSSISKPNTMSLPSFLNKPTSSTRPSIIPSKPREPSFIISRSSNPPSIVQPSDHPSIIVSRPSNLIEPMTLDPSPEINEPTNSFPMNDNTFPIESGPSDSFPIVPGPTDNIPAISSDISTSGVINVDMTSNMEIDNTTNIGFSFFEQHETGGESNDFFSSDTNNQPFDFLSSFAPIGNVDHSSVNVSSGNDITNIGSLGTNDSSNGNMFSFLNPSSSTETRSTNDVFDIFNFGSNEGGASSSATSGGGSFFNF